MWLYPVRSTTTEEVIKKLEVQAETFGNPNRIITDRGTAFTSNTFSEYCKERDICQLMITTGVPRGNGQIERVNRTIIPVLTKLSLDDPQKWYKKVSKVQQVLNCTIQRSIGMSPFELMVGKRMKTKETEGIHEILNEEMVRQFGAEREEKRQLAKRQILRVQEENRRGFNKKRKGAEVYQLGDLVATKRTQFATQSKLLPKFLGPYRVIEVKPHDRYELEKLNEEDEGPTKTSASADHLKRWYFGESDSSEPDEEAGGPSCGFRGFEESHE